MPKYPQVMCTTVAQSTTQKWVTSDIVLALFVAVDKLPHLYTQYTALMHSFIHSLVVRFNTVKMRVILTVHRAYKELETSKLNLINR